MQFGYLEVAAEDILEVRAIEAIAKCQEMGDGWRLPSKIEYGHLLRIGAMSENKGYWIPSDRPPWFYAEETDLPYPYKGDEIWFEIQDVISLIRGDDDQLVKQMMDRIPSVRAVGEGFLDVARLLTKADSTENAVVVDKTLHAMLPKDRKKASDWTHLQQALEPTADEAQESKALAILCRNFAFSLFQKSVANIEIYCRPVRTVEFEGDTGCEALIKGSHEHDRLRNVFLRFSKAFHDLSVLLIKWEGNCDRWRGFSIESVVYKDGRRLSGNVALSGAQTKAMTLLDGDNESEDIFTWFDVKIGFKDDVYCEGYILMKFDVTNDDQEFCWPGPFDESEEMKIRVSRTFTGIVIKGGTFKAGSLDDDEPGDEGTRVERYTKDEFWPVSNRIAFAGRVDSGRATKP